jgi:decaprenyl-phosphate phosphoribosyltransferase
MHYKAYLRLIRPKHYLKNLLVFVPLVFSGYLFDGAYLLPAIYSFLAFSAVASVVYVVNDLRDKELDKLHKTKKNRPIASGAVSTKSAIVLVTILLGLASLFQYLAGISLFAVLLLLLYLFLNITYSFGLKNVPVIDVSILSLGFVIRVLYGGYSVGIDVSEWLYLAILAFSFYLALGKRRNEIRTNGTKTRRVNKHYNQDFLDKNMYVCLGLTLTYYSLWAVDPMQKHKLMYMTIPVVIVIVMTYSLMIETLESEGDPVSVLVGNKYLSLLVVVYGALVAGIIYA